jgi:hypothetical protein
LPVRVTSHETGKTVVTYALLDSGATVTLCQDQLLTDLGVSGRTEQLRLSTVGNSGRVSTTRTASLTVTNLRDDCSLHLPQVHSKGDLHLDQSHMVTEDEINQWPHLRGLKLRHASAENVTLLIGQDCPEALEPLNTLLGAAGEPYAVRTRLGWTVSGPVSNRKNVPATFFTSTATPGVSVNENPQAVIPRPQVRAPDGPAVSPPSGSITTTPARPPLDTVSVKPCTQQYSPKHKHTTTHAKIALAASSATQADTAVSRSHSRATRTFTRSPEISSYILHTRPPEGTHSSSARWGSLARHRRRLHRRRGRAHATDGDGTRDNSWNKE